MTTPYFNGLTAAEAERLAILAEEMGEAQQAIGKILRHGYESFNPDVLGSDSNRGNLERELGDVMFSITMVCDAEDVSHIAVMERAQQKSKKIIPYLHHQTAR